MIPEHWRRAALEPPTAWGAAPPASGVIRSTPEDFEVEEILGFAASGSGPHALLTVRKRGANTEWVARELARAAGCKPFDVGFAGLKDRNAVTTQAFTVPLGKRAPESFVGTGGEGWEVLAAAAHQRKLPRGALEGNRFSITVRGLRGDPARLHERLEQAKQGGVPNYFGLQRFGRGAGNLEQVLKAAAHAGERGRSRGRGDQGFTLSAARSLVFNAILAARIEAQTWNRMLPGDVAILDGRGSVFAVEGVDAEIERRCAALEIHPTAPLVGDGESLAADPVRGLETMIADRFPEAVAVIRAERMKAERRALRLRAGEFVHDLQGDVLRLRFSLSAGSFATAVLREIITTGEAGE